MISTGLRREKTDKIGKPSFQLMSGRKQEETITLRTKLPVLTMGNKVAAEILYNNRSSGTHSITSSCVKPRTRKQKR